MGMQVNTVGGTIYFAVNGTYRVQRMVLKSARVRVQREFTAQPSPLKNDIFCHYES